MQHILLTGDIQVGKSTVLNAVLNRHPDYRISGFLTVCAAPENGIGKVYLVPAADKTLTDEEHLVGYRNIAQKEFTAVQGAFDRLAEGLFDKKTSDLYIMDEIGAMESDDFVFQHRIFEVFDRHLPSLGVIRKQDTPFLNQIRASGKAEIYEVTKENRDAMVDLIDQRISDLVADQRDYRTRASCGGAVLREIDGVMHVLLIHSSRWAFPKGHMEKGETRLETARREVLEETGITADFADDFEMQMPSKDGKRQVFAYIGTYVSGNCTPQQGETTEVVWYPLELAADKVLLPQDKELMRRVQAYVENKH